MAHRNLKFLKDRYLIEDIQLNNDDESLEELHRRYKNMYYKQAHKFKNFFNINNINLDEILKDSYYMIYDSAKTFDYNKKIKYITWLGSKCKFYFLNKSLKKDKSHKILEYRDSEKELDELSSADIIQAPNNNLANHSQIISFLKDHPDERLLKIFELRYCTNSTKAATWKNISKNFGLSSQTIINLHRKGLNFLRKKADNFV